MHPCEVQPNTVVELVEKQPDFRKRISKIKNFKLITINSSITV